MRWLGREQVNELLATLGANKLRTALTGFAVGWGILLLVILLSAGNGISNGIKQAVDRQGMQERSVTLYAGYVEKPRGGLTEGQDIKLTRSMLRMLQESNAEDISMITPLKRAAATLEYGGMQESKTIVGVEPEYGQVKTMHFAVAGSRFINDKDRQEARKVVLIPEALAKGLFEEPDRALGKTILINTIAFKVVGVIKDENSWAPCYIPLATMELLHLGEEEGLSSIQIVEAEMICPNVQTEEDCDRLAQRLRTQLSPLIGTDPNDEQVLFLSSAAAGNAMMTKVIMGIDTFLWIIGLSSLTIGLIGVITIMQISIAERSREIGVRKALGAKPNDIIVMILMESVLITLISGLAGLSLGVGLMAGVDYLWTLSQSSLDHSKGFNAADMFVHPVITLSTAIGAIVVMLIGGLLAGYLPARKAVKVSVVEAMRH